MEATTAQQLLDETLTQYGVPGAQIGLLRGSERVVVCAGSRVAGTDDAVLPETAFHAGSLTKALVGLIVIDAAGRGALNLDVPCSGQADGLWEETPRSLLSQTSGRPNVLPTPHEDLDEFVASTASLPLLHAPGRFSYCNAGWCVLDLLLQRTTGRSFEELAQAALGPTTTFGMPEGAAGGHVLRPGEQPVATRDNYATAASAAGSRWWATADQLLDFMALNLHGGDGIFADADVRGVRATTARLPGATAFDSWGLGWALWDRGDHQAFGWAGMTGGHRAFARAFPEQDAALVVLANGAGPLTGPPGGSALFDAILPQLLELLEVPALPAPQYGEANPLDQLAGRYGGATVEASGPDTLKLQAESFGIAEPVTYERLGGDTFDVAGNPPGSMPVAFDDDLLYLGPFALPRS